MDECMLNDLLECSVCLERLDTSSKVLPCQHTFCKKCLEEIINRHRELRCPECRVLVDIKIDDLPPNVLLMRILEGMRNATPKNTKLLHLKNIQQQQQQRNFGNQQIVTTTQISAVNTNVVSPVVSVTVDPTRHANASAKQVHLHNQPYGRAIYDYISKVPGDLSFKKGDIVVLRKKIDNNWYYGESGTNHGVFPLSYVQVMTPLPPHVPQCKALYDFRMRNDEEDGCLTFNKGEVISVIRRVDENWAEGKLLDRIGIFPLAFVELNSVARALMKLSTNVQPGPSRVAPPTPTNEETTPLIPTDHSRNIQTSNQPRPQAVPSSTSLLVSDSSSSTVSSGGSSATTSPNTPNSSTTSSSSSSTAPSSPSSPALSPQNTSGIQRVKRHSFTGINTTNPPPQLHSHSHHRHSAEILSQPDTNNDNNTTTTTTTINETFSSSVNSTAITVTITTTTNSIPSTTVTSSTAAATTTTTINSSIPSVEHNIRHRRSGSSDLVLNQTNLPSAYIALYPYKPQKVDELELRKGGIYMVTERCQDGWFKGTSNRTQKCGVFPGNYVAPAKCQRGICRITNTSSTNHQASSVLSTTTTTTTTSTTTTNNQAINDSRLPVTYTKSKNNVTAQAYSPRSLPPPELPPRALSPSSSSSGVSVSWHGQAQQNSPRLGGCEQGPGNPLGRSHSAVMSNNSISSSPGKTMLTPSLAAGNTSCSSSENNRSPNNTLRLTGGLTPPPNTLVGNASLVGHSSAAKSTEKIKSKEKKEKGVSLMRRLTNIKKSKSPPPTTYSMDNPVFDDGNFVSSADAVHVRSGSCPSQLLEMRQPQDSPSKTNHHRLYPGNVQGNATTSQRIKHKERPSLPVSFLQRSGEAGAVVTPGSGNHHRKSNSLDAGIGKQNKQQSASRERERVNRFRCIVPYPPNSEFELELRVGDIIYVQKKRDDGWYKGTQQRTGRTGLFPASFVEAF